MKIWKVAEMKNWDKNPRGILEEDFKQLLEQLKMGTLKNVLLMPDGTVLGGNMRLRAFREAGIEEWPAVEVDFKQNEGGLWYAVVSEKEIPDKTYESKEAGMLAYSLVDNSQSGYYETEKLAEMITGFNAFPLAEFKIPLGHPVQLPSLIQSFGPPPPGQPDKDNPNELDEKYDNYLNSSIKQIVLYFSNEEYKKLMARIEPIMEETGAENHTKLFVLLLQHYENTVTTEKED